MAAARLLTEDAAKAYLDGLNPRALMQPLKLAGRNYWDRHAIDIELDRRSGIDRRGQDAPSSELEAWEAEHGETAA